MHSLAPEAYLETQVTTATPQRLRLMLIEGAQRRARAAQAAWEAGRITEGVEAIEHCRNIITELISGIHPDQTPTAKQVLGIHLFLLSALTEAQFAHDGNRLVDVLRVLDEEQQTWQAVCEQMPDRPVAPAAAAAEEVAPQRVMDAWAGDYREGSAASGADRFSIEA
jgi:flagellar secretion chaperone FliS